MKDEVLAKVYDTDAQAVPRYKIIDKDGATVQEGVEIQLMNTITQQGTPYSRDAVLKDETAAMFGLDDTATPDDVFKRVTGILVQVTAPTGSTVTCSKDSITLTATEVSGVWEFHVPTYGTWTFTATLGSDSRSAQLTIDTCKLYTLSITYSNIFGVCWNMSNSSTALSRVTAANDPNGVVSVDITTEPVPAVGTGSGSSPFDEYYPWNKMEEWNIVSNAVYAKRGSSNFSRTSNDTVVFIPEFWYKVVNDTATNRRYFYIADQAVDGFTKHPGSGRCIGKYNTISGYYSKSGAAPLVSITRATARTNSHSKGSKWYQYDFASWCAVQMLYLVEYADWNSQTCIGRGYVDSNSAAISSGGCDSMTYHTGRAAGTDGKTAVMYRWCENLWGNVNDWCDGANFSERASYICTTPANFADDTSTNYTAAGVTLPNSNYISGMGYSSAFPWAFIPNAAAGSETTYVPDYVGSSTGWRVLCVGGGWGGAGGAGLFCFDASAVSSYSSANFGARLLYLPTASEIAQMAA